MTPDSSAADSFILASHYSPHRAMEPLFVVLHTIECPPGKAARGLAEWWANPDSPHTSAHYTCDDSATIQMVREADSAWAAGQRGNMEGIHIEIAGRTAMSDEEWLEHEPTLDRAAALVAEICARRGFPLVLLDPVALVRGDRGVTTHKAIARAWAQTDHHDPGDWLADEVLRRAVALGNPA